MLAWHLPPVSLLRVKLTSSVEPRPTTAAPTPRSTTAPRPAATSCPVVIPPPEILHGETPSLLLAPAGRGARCQPRGQSCIELGAMKRRQLLVFLRRRRLIAS